MSVARFAFGPRLKAHRERQGITLQEIADTTKIAASLLSSLERNDVTQWPKGIYRRAFLRAYTRAIDIPFEPVWAEFSQLFPEEGAESVPSSGETHQLRLTLASSTERVPIPSQPRLIAAAADVMAVLIVGLLLALMTGFSAWTTLTIVSLLYAGVSTALLGGSLADWFLRTSSARRSFAAAQSAVTPARDGERAIAAPTDVDSAPSRTGADVPSAAPTAQSPRPRIFAVAPPRTVLAAEPREAQKRRAADR
jgi:transcriptional regulator with XRE-family HTH domain